jgi:hypothetical protein
MQPLLNLRLLADKTPALDELKTELMLSLSLPSRFGDTFALV